MISSRILCLILTFLLLVLQFHVHLDDFMSNIAPLLNTLYIYFIYPCPLYIFWRGIDIWISLVHLGYSPLFYYFSLFNLLFILMYWIYHFSYIFCMCVLDMGYQVHSYRFHFSGESHHLVICCCQMSLSHLCLNHS